MKTEKVIKFLLFCFFLAVFLIAANYSAEADVCEFDFGYCCGSCLTSSCPSSRACGNNCYYFGGLCGFHDCFWTSTCNYYCYDSTKEGAACDTCQVLDAGRNLYFYNYADVCGISGWACSSSYTPTYCGQTYWRTGPIQGACCANKCSPSAGCFVGPYNYFCQRICNDYCSGAKLVEYDNDCVPDSTVVNGTCTAACSCNTPSCPATVTHCCPGRCGATCDSNDDCPNNSCSQTFDDYCSGNQLVEYDSDCIKDSTTVADACTNTCQSTCSCTNCSVNCPAPSTVTHCCLGNCGAVCTTGSNQSCGNCGTQTCQADCTWGSCSDKKIDGQTCSGGGECCSGHCVDGVCCNSSCAGTCQSCDYTGHVGTCYTHPEGTDPDNECSPSSWHCSGQCQLYRRPGTCDGDSAACENEDWEYDNIDSGYVCTGISSQTPVSSSDYCNYDEDCDSGDCSATEWFTSCNGSGACRIASDHTDAASQTVFADSGYSLTNVCGVQGSAQCNGTDHCSGNTRYSGYMCNGSGSCNLDNGDIGCCQDSACLSCGFVECAGSFVCDTDTYSCTGVCNSVGNACGDCGFCLGGLCSGEGVCSPGANQNCGNCGSQTCESDCTWGSCLGEGICSPGATQSCGDCGSQTCQADCSWESCTGEGVCSPGTNQSCGDCGSQTCQADCSWESCTGEGVCSPGTNQSCGDCGSQTCQADCSWESCIGTEPPESQVCGSGDCVGTQTRDCLADGTWDSWSDCSSDGNPCGSCGICLGGSCIGEGCPPNKPQSTSETWDYSAWGSTPQALPGTSLILSWVYSDPGSNPQTSYEIWVDDDSAFTGSKFNMIVDPSGSTSYSLDLSADQEGDWLSQLNWNSTYYWQVRVKNNVNILWSEWSDIDSFITRDHANPYSYFVPSPQNPAVDEVVVFIQDNSTFAESLCYNGGEHYCGDDPGVTYEWNFDYPSGPTSDKKGNASTTYSGEGSYTVRLLITDNTLPIGDNFSFHNVVIDIGSPLPEWREVSPF